MKCTPSAWRQCPDQARRAAPGGATRRRRTSSRTNLREGGRNSKSRRPVVRSTTSRPRRRAVAAARGGDVQGPGPPRAVGRGHGREDGQGLLRQHEDGRDAVGEARARSFALFFLKLLYDPEITPVFDPGVR